MKEGGGEALSQISDEQQLITVQVFLLSSLVSAFWRHFLLFFDDVCFSDKQSRCCRWPKSQIVWPLHIFAHPAFKCVCCIVSKGSQVSKLTSQFLIFFFGEKEGEGGKSWKAKHFCYVLQTAVKSANSFLIL